MHKQFLLVPQRVSDTTATVWIGGLNEDVRAKRVTLEFSNEQETDLVELDSSEWQTWKSQHPLDWRLGQSPSEIQRLHYQRVTLGLQKTLRPRTTYSLSLRVDDKIVGDSARVTTLPTTLPSTDEKPFTLLLGSCFYCPNDKQGMVGKTFHYLPSDERPEIKILCGDQVYLDNPWKVLTYFVTRPFQAPSSLRTIFFEKYIDNWTQSPTADSGFRQLLKDGANYFCSDDHEFWNNAPDIGGVGLINTLLRPQREWWFREATELFRVFQSPSPLMNIEVAPLSICVADTRINRHTRRRQFMEDYDLKAVGRWIAGLEGPGILVIGQPLLTPKSNLWSLHRYDLSLPDYEQYDELLGYIRAAQHSIILLTGDVHFGRVASCFLNREAGTKFVEVISSPMMVVTNRKGKAEVGEFVSASAIDPPIISPIEEEVNFAEQQNHFLTLEFSLATDKKIKMRVKFWPILKNAAGLPPRSKNVYETTLY